MKLVIVHYHLRPGGIRRVIQLASPHLVRHAPEAVTSVVVATGEAGDRLWHERFAKELNGLPVQVFVEPAFNYFSEQNDSPQELAGRIRRALEAILDRPKGEGCLVWAHNPGVGRNLMLSKELAEACAVREIPLVAHHHDWWFDNRWMRWPEMRRCGFRQLAAAAQAVFPKSDHAIHAAINQADAKILSRHLGKRALWLPNLTERAPTPSRSKVRAAQRWLRNKLAHDGAPVWLLPCRTLRRKNIAEALLLKRWLRPEAWLVVTGAVSSNDEKPYFEALERAAHEHHWRLRLGVLGGDEARKPGVPELMAASEAVLLTSIQEGFGLPYLEASAARRPLIARRLPNIAPDLDRFGFRFPQAYEEILVDPSTFDWRAERTRQLKRFRDWRNAMPDFARRRVATPPMLTARPPGPVGFSRLTLTAQLEVLARPANETWKACAMLNPFLETWRRRAAAGKLQLTPWPRKARRWLDGEAYAKRFFAAVAANHGRSQLTVAPRTIQSDFIAAKLHVRNLYPLLWSKEP